MGARTSSESVLAIYLALTLPLYFVVGEFSALAWSMYGLHAAALLYFLWGYRLWARNGGADSVVRDIVPLALCVLLYSEVAWLNRAFYPDHYLDAAVIGWETALFRSHPAMDFRGALPWGWLSEYLHFGYFSYYFIVPIMIASVWAASGRQALRTAVGSVVLVFALGFVVFIAFPVAGPYYEYTRMEISGLFPACARWVVDKGSSIGTAFPSSHVSVSVTVWIMCLRYAPRVGFFLVLIVPALALGAVYGGFHYALDILAGAALGLFAGTVGHAWVRRLDGSTKPPRVSPPSAPPPRTARPSTEYAAG